MHSLALRSILRRAAIVLLMAIAFCGCNRSSEAKAAAAIAKGKAFLAKKDYARAMLQFRAAAKFQPKNAEGLYHAGLVYLEIGDVQNAANYLMRATQADPTFGAAQIKVAELMALNGDLEVVREAERRAQAALKASTTTADAIATLALAEIRLGKDQSAEEHLREATSRFPRDLRSYVLMAALKFRQNDFAGAEQILKNAVAQSPKGSEPLVALGRFYQIRGDNVQAEARFRAAVNLDSKNGMALADLAGVLIALERKPEAEQIFKRMSELPDKQFNPAYALFLFNDGQRDAAVKEFERLHLADAADRPARTRLVAAYIALNRLDGAERVLTESLKKNAKDLDALLQRAEIRILGAKYQEARKDLNAVTGFRPDSAQAHYLLARVHQLEGARLNQRRELTEALRYDPNLLIARVDLAQSLIEAQDPKAALDLLHAAPEQQRNSTILIVQQNWALIGAGNFAGAAKGVAQGLAAGRNAELLLQSAVLELQQRKFAEAHALLLEALKIAPGEVRALDLLARSFVAQNKPDEALATVRQYAASQPKSAPVQQFAGMWLTSSGHPDEARAAFKAAKAADPNFTAADIATAQLDLTQRKFDDARGILSNMVNTNDRNVDAKLLLGMVEEASGHFEQAIVQYQKVVETEPSNPIALNNLSYRLSGANRPDEALRYAQQAVELNPSNLAFEDTLGWAFVQKGMLDAALQHLSIAGKSGVPVRMYHLAYAYAKAGNLTKARETYSAAQKIDPSLPEATIVGKLVGLTK